MSLLERTLVEDGPGMPALSWLVNAIGGGDDDDDDDEGRVREGECRSVRSARALFDRRYKYEGA